MTDGAEAVTGASRPIFTYIPHPHIAAHKLQKPAKTADEQVGFNAKIAVLITTIVGTMWVAYIFTVIALVSFPAAIGSGNTITIVGWIAQTFLQLVLLPIIIVGQNVQARVSDKRAEQTFTDAEAILHECLQMQAHLEAQDSVLNDLVTRLEAVVSKAG